MIEKRPDLFSAFVGTGQIVGMLAEQIVQYRYALEHATASHDQKMLSPLRQLGEPPYRTLEAYGRFQACCRNPFWPADDVAAITRLQAFLVDSPALSLSELYDWVQALRTSEVKLDRLLMTLPDLRITDTKFAVPVFFTRARTTTSRPPASCPTTRQDWRRPSRVSTSSRTRGTLLSGPTPTSFCAPWTEMRRRHRSYPPLPQRPSSPAVRRRPRYLRRPAAPTRTRPHVQPALVPSSPRL
jgi:hypothetical protein